jgi:biotin carboxylase
LLDVDLLLREGVCAVATNHLLIVGADPEAEDALSAAERLSWEATLFPLPAAPGREQPSSDAIVDAAESCGAEGLYCADKWAAEPVALAAQRLGLQTHPPEVVRNLHNKLAFRRILDVNGLAGPRFMSAQVLEDAETAVKELGLPVVVKPVDAADSRGAYRLDHIEELPLAFAKARRSSPTATLLLEEFLEGDAFAVDGVLVQGAFHFAAVVARETCPPPFLFDMALHTLPDLNEASQVALLGEAEAALAAIGLTDAVFHVELTLTESGPRVVEVSTCVPRHIGTHLLPAACGIDLLAEALRFALGFPPGQEASPECGAALCWISSNSGIVTSIEGVDQARALPGVEQVEITTEPGKRLGHAVDIPSRDAVGWVLATGETGDSALVTAQAAVELCQIVTHPVIL